MVYTPRNRRKSAGQNMIGRSTSSYSGSTFGNNMMSRGSFVKGAGAVFGAVAAAGLGLSGVAKAQELPPWMLCAFEYFGGFPGPTITITQNAYEGCPMILQMAVSSYPEIQLESGNYDLNLLEPFTGNGALMIAQPPIPEPPPIVVERIVGVAQSVYPFNQTKPRLFASQNVTNSDEGPWYQSVYIQKPNGPLTLTNLEIEHNGWDAVLCVGSNGLTFDACTIKANESILNVLSPYHYGDLTITNCELIHKGHGNFGSYDTGFDSSKTGWGGVTVYDMDYEHFEFGEIGDINFTGNTLTSLQNTAVNGFYFHGGRAQGRILETKISGNTITGPVYGIYVGPVFRMPMEKVHIDYNTVTCINYETYNLFEGFSEGGLDPVYNISGQSGIHIYNFPGLIQEGSTASGNTVKMHPAENVPLNPPYEGLPLFDEQGNPIEYSYSFITGMHFGYYTDYDPDFIPAPLCVSNMTVSGNTIEGNYALMDYPFNFDNACEYNEITGNTVTGKLKDFDFYGGIPALIKLSNVPGYGVPQNNTLSGNIVGDGSSGPICIQCDGSNNKFLNNYLGSFVADLFLVRVIGNQNTFQGNDYGDTGLTGWLDNSLPIEDRRGCIISWFGSQKNTFNETLFPAGTNACSQILDLGAANDVINPDAINKNLNCKNTPDTALLRLYYNEHKAKFEKHIIRAFGFGKGISGFINGISRHWPKY